MLTDERKKNFEKVREAALKLLFESQKVLVVMEQQEMEGSSFYTEMDGISHHIDGWIIKLKQVEERLYTK